MGLVFCDLKVVWQRFTVLGMDSMAVASKGVVLRDVIFVVYLK
jgi:hypothetical protein